MEVVIIFAALAFAVNKTVSVIKAIGKDNNLVITQITVWVVGFIALLLAANAQVTSAFALPGFEVPLGDLDIPSLILLAWMLGGSGSFAYDFKKAVDSSDSSAEPSLLGPNH